MLQWDGGRVARDLRRNEAEAAWKPSKGERSLRNAL